MARRGGAIIKINEKVTLYWLWDNLTEANVYATVIFLSVAAAQQQNHMKQQQLYPHWHTKYIPNSWGMSLVFWERVERRVWMVWVAGCVLAKYSCGPVRLAFHLLSHTRTHKHLLISLNKRHYYWTHTPQQFPIFPTFPLHPLPPPRTHMWPNEHVKFSTAINYFFTRHTAFSLC